MSGRRDERFLAHLSGTSKTLGYEYARLYCRLCQAIVEEMISS